MSRGRSLSRATTFSVPYPGAGGGPRPWTPPMVAPALRAGCAAGHRRLLPLKGPARHSYRPRGCRACVAQIHRGNRERPFTPCPAAPSTVTGLAPGPPGLGRLRSTPAPPGGGGAAAEPVRSPPPERRGEREAARPPAPQVGGVPGGGTGRPFPPTRNARTHPPSLRRRLGERPPAESPGAAEPSLPTPRRRREGAGAWRAAGSRGRVRAGRVGKSLRGRGYLRAGGGAANGGGGAGLRGPAAAFGSRPRAEGGPGPGTGLQLPAIASSRKAAASLS